MRKKQHAAREKQLLRGQYCAKVHKHLRLRLLSGLQAFQKRSRVLR